MAKEEEEADEEKEAKAEVDLSQVISKSKMDRENHLTNPR